jgi:translation elongation factor EF-Tu-like GTPase
MLRIHRAPDDFEAMIRIFRPAEGGRATPPFNGIRWDFAYAENQPVGELDMIYPDFYDEHGESLPTNRPLPIGIEIPARVVVIFDEMREKLHRSRIRAGVRFYCHEGGKRVAQGRITKVTGLFNSRRKQ